METNRRTVKSVAPAPAPVRMPVRMLMLMLMLVVALALSCQRDQAPKRPEGEVVARVGNAYLTLDDLAASIPLEYRDAITREQNVQYVRQWVNTELLYQEALRLKINEEPEIRARLERMRKDLLSAEIISRGASSTGAEVSEQAVREYYETNRSQFVREHNVARYEVIVVDSLSVAWEVRRTVTPETFRSVAKAQSKIPVGLDEGVPYVAMESIPPVVRNAILSAAIPSITGPYRSEDGFHIVRVVARFDKGTVASLEEVRDEIVSRLSNITQKGETERLLADIRSRSEVEFNIDKIPGAGGDAVPVPSPSTGGAGD